MPSDDLIEAGQRPNDLIAAVRRDHAETGSIVDRTPDVMHDAVRGLQAKP